MKCLVPILALGLVAAAFASINLTSPTVVTVGGVQSESDAQAGVGVYSVNFSGTPSLDVYFHQGTVSGQSINKGTIVPIIELSINLTNGAWMATNGRSGTLSGAQLTSINTTLRNNRNALETFAINNGVIDGTQVAW